MISSKDLVHLRRKEKAFFPMTLQREIAFHGVLIHRYGGRLRLLVERHQAKRTLSQPALQYATQDGTHYCFEGDAIYIPMLERPELVSKLKDPSIAGWGPHPPAHNLLVADIVNQAIRAFPAYRRRAFKSQLFKSLPYGLGSYFAATVLLAYFRTKHQKSIKPVIANNIIY